jgi:thioredoxin 1
MFRRRHAAEPETNTVTVGADAPVVAITDDNFADTTAGTCTVVDFWAPWCGPCHAFAPTFEAVARQSPEGIRFGACNVDENPRTASLLQIMSIPTLVVFGPDGSELGRNVGVASRQALESLVEELSNRGS